MLPASFKEENSVFSKHPKDKGVEIFDLPTYVGSDAGENPVIVSFWKPSKEDMEEIQRTGGFYLIVYSAKMPPVSLITENPFTGLNSLGEKSE